mmetsp:Transcript_11521/g.31085  ORF Transcript_11521/g.31085 Transcript_11521/m.31085 type:complete len:215 (+) Transcript_11521:2756-3400(+)
MVFEQLGREEGRALDQGLLRVVLHSEHLREHGSEIHAHDSRRLEGGAPVLGVVSLGLLLDQSSHSLAIEAELDLLHELGVVGRVLVALLAHIAEDGRARGVGPPRHESLNDGRLLGSGEHVAHGVSEDNDRLWQLEAKEPVVRGRALQVELVLVVLAIVHDHRIHALPQLVGAARALPAVIELLYALPEHVCVDAVLLRHVRKGDRASPADQPG